MNSGHYEKSLLGTQISEDVRVHMPPPPALDQSVVTHGVLVRKGLGWFRWLITCRAHQSCRHHNDYRVMLHDDATDASTNKMKLQLNRCGIDEGATVGAWVFVEVGQQEGVRRLGRPPSLNLRNTELSSLCGKFVFDARSVNAAVHYSQQHMYTVVYDRLSKH